MSTDKSEDAISIRKTAEKYLAAEQFDKLLEISTNKKKYNGSMPDE